MERADWVAFDKDGYPFGFGSAEFMSGAEARDEFSGAAEIRLVVGEERSELLHTHANGKENFLKVGA